MVICIPPFFFFYCFDKTSVSIFLSLLCALLQNSRKITFATEYFFSLRFSCADRITRYSYKSQKKSTLQLIFFLSAFSNG